MVYIVYIQYLNIKVYLSEQNLQSPTLYVSRENHLCKITFGIINSLLYFKMKLKYRSNVKCTPRFIFNEYFKLP
jgi:hypothetical protein